MNVQVTKHGKDRIKERIGLSKNLAKQNAEKAFLLGIKHSDTKGSLNRYFTALYFKYQTANNIRIYNRKVYIFQNKKLITVFDLPKKFFKYVDKINGRRNNK